MLPINKIVLYKHGVGYFEREGSVTGAATIDLGFKASEMNDVLKSLTVLDLDGGHVASISYESTMPVDKQLEAVTIHLPDGSAISGLLGQVKGASVAVELGGRRVEGKVAGIESVSRHRDGATVHESHLSLLVDGTSLESFDLLECKSITFLDESLRKDLQHLLEILIAAKKKDLKRLTIFAHGEGERRLVASYIVETPVWKTSYRVLLKDDAKSALIQGWALVDNTQDEDWEDVALTLVAGLPISFVHDLYSPRYKRRPVVRVQEEEAYAPPVLEEGIGDPFADADEDAYGGMDRMMGAGPGASMPPPAPPPPPAPAARGRSMASALGSSTKVQTRTVEVGDLFQYEIQNPVTVKRNQSALVPILQGDFEGKRVAIYNPDVRDKNPMSAVFLKNSTGMTLEGGPMTVLEADTYVGEAMLETLKPAEERIVPYSVELGCLVSLDQKSEVTAFHRAKITNGTLYLHRYRVDRKVYLIKNKIDRDLDLFVDHRFNDGWELVETPEPFEKTDSFYRFRLDAPAKKTTSFVVAEKRDDHESFSLHHATKDQVGMWLKSRYIDDATRESLDGIVVINEEIAEKDRRVTQRESDIQEIFENQKRLRENMRALGSSDHEKRLRERYVGELGREEDRLERYRTEIGELREAKKELERRLRKQIDEMRFEAKL